MTEEPIFRVNRGRLWLSLLALIVLCPSFGRAQQAERKKESGKDELKFVLIVTRHGVRAPTWSNDELNKYSVSPWPRWEVPPGYLTPHGYQLLQLFGAYNRRRFAEAGLLSSSGCADASGIYLWADTDQRTMASGRALADGLMKGCDLPVRSLGAGVRDPLFHPLSAGVGSASQDKALAALKERLHDDPAVPVRANQEALEELQKILMKCQPATACPAERSLPAKRILEIPPSFGESSGDHGATLNGPLTVGSSLAENFLLEYANGSAAETVGWGAVSEAQVRKIISLHTAYFDLLHRTPYLARAEGSNLLDHIAKTLTQAAGGQPVKGAIGEPGGKLVILVGHDTNLAGIASLLNLSWVLDWRKDDTPPGAELHFELWSDGQGRFTVRLTYAAQTLAQMRNASVLELDTPPAQTSVPLTGCAPAGRACQLEDFQRMVRSAIDPSFVSASPD